MTRPGWARRARIKPGLPSHRKARGFIGGTNLTYQAAATVYDLQKYSLLDIETRKMQCSRLLAIRKFRLIRSKVVVPPSLHAHPCWSEDETVASLNWKRFFHVKLQIKTAAFMTGKIFEMPQSSTIALPGTVAVDT